MGPDLTTRRASACPTCGASVRPDATFCGQCYTDFRPPPPAPEPAPRPVTPGPSAAYGTPAPDALTAPLLDVLLPTQGAAPAVEAPGPSAPPAATPKALPSWPCSRCEARNALEDAFCHSCGTPFLSVVSEQSKVSVTVPLFGDLNQYGRGQRALIALGAIAAVLVPLALVVLLTTKSPPASPSPGTTGTTQTTDQTGQQPLPQPTS